MLIFLVVGYVLISTRNEASVIKPTTKNPSMTATQSATLDANTLIGKVGQLMELPADEKPTIATVSDVNKLQGQPFFDKAQNDDKVLIYKAAKEAILYRPSENKIINVGPITGN